MRYAILISAIVLFFCSCSHKSNGDLAIFKSTIISLDYSSRAINDVTEDTRKKLTEKLNDLRYFVPARLWQPRAVVVSKLADSIISYLHESKSELINECGIGGNVDLIFKTDYFKAVNKIFFEQQKGKVLYDKLGSFIDSISSVTNEFNNSVVEYFKSDYNYLNFEKSNSKEFTKIFFGKISVAAALCVLARFENDVRNIENKVIDLCYYYTLPGCNLGYERFNAILGQSSNCVKAGDNIELCAGIGSFSTAAQPKFVVDNKTISCNEEGVMIYKFKTPLKPGEYSKAVKIQYTKPDGTKESKDYSIEYSVINPNQK